MRAFFVFLCTAMLLVTSPAWAKETVDLKNLTLVLPDDWMVVQAPSEDGDGLITAVFGKKDKSASLVMLSGKSEGKPAKEVAELLASSLGAVEKPIEYKGQYGYAVKNDGIDGFSIVSADKDVFLACLMLGEMPVFKDVVESMKSDKHPEIVPK